MWCSSRFLLKEQKGGEKMNKMKRKIAVITGESVLTLGIGFSGAGILEYGLRSYLLTVETWLLSIIAAATLVLIASIHPKVKRWRRPLLVCCILGVLLIPYTALAIGQIDIYVKDAAPPWILPEKLNVTMGDVVLFTEDGKNVTVLSGKTFELFPGGNEVWIGRLDIPKGCYKGVRALPEVIEVYLQVDLEKLSEALKEGEIGPVSETKTEKTYELPEGMLGPGGCTTREECEAYCRKPENAEECRKWDEEYRKKQYRLPEGMLGPGGCATLEECEAYCQAPENRDECRKWCEENPGICPETIGSGEAKKAYKEISVDELKEEILKRSGRVEEETNGAVRMEVLSVEENTLYVKLTIIIKKVREIEKLPAGTGPGGCASLEECDAYCKKPENREECAQWCQKYPFACPSHAGGIDVEIPEIPETFPAEFCYPGFGGPDITLDIVLDEECFPEKIQPIIHLPPGIPAPEIPATQMGIQKPKLFV
jgi:hypothetical protein